MLEGVGETAGCTVLSATTSAKPSPLKSALTTPFENSVGVMFPQPKQPRSSSSQLASMTHKLISGRDSEVTRI